MTGEWPLAGTHLNVLSFPVPEERTHVSTMPVSAWLIHFEDLTG
jgi:hypothetical protein